MGKRTPEELAEFEASKLQATKEYVAQDVTRRERTARLREQRLARDNADPKEREPVSAPRRKSVQEKEIGRVGGQKFFKGNPEAGSIK